MKIVILESGALALALTMLFALPAQAGVDSEDYDLRLEAEENAIGEFELVDVSVVIDFPDGNELQGYQWGVCNDEYLTLEDEGDVIKGSGVIDLSYTFESVSLIDSNDDDVFEGWTVGALFNVITGDTLEPEEDVQVYVCTYESGAVDDDIEPVDSVIEFCDTLGSPAVNTQLIVFDSIELVPMLVAATISVGPIPPPPLGLRAPDVELSEDSIDISIMLDNPEPEGEEDTVEVFAFSFGLTHDDSFVTVSTVEQGAALEDFNDGTGPSYFASILDPDGAAGITVACVVSFGPTDFEFLGNSANGQEIALVTYDAVVGAPEDSVSDLEFVDTLGSPAVATTFTVQEAQSLVPDTTTGSITITIPEVPIFLRGDANDDGIIDISDPFYLARALFDDGPELTCDDAGDADDNESLGIADALDILAYLFTGGDDLPAPFPDCGPGTELPDDALLCETSQVGSCL